MENTTPIINSVPVTDSASKKAKTSLILGIVGMFAWFIPLFGLPINIVGIVFASKGLQSSKRKLALIGITLSIMGLVLSIVNASIGAYLGATGQHPVVNEIMNR